MCIRDRCFAWTCAPPRDFSVFDLSLPSYLFPSDAIVDVLQPDTETFGARDAGNMTVYWSSGRGLAIYNVRQFSSSVRAEKFYSTLRSLDDPYYHPTTDVSFNSQLADSFALGCGFSEFGGYRCDMTAQYEEFVISFNSIIDDEMSFGQFEEIANFIDARIRSEMEP